MLPEGTGWQGFVLAALLGAVVSSLAAMLNAASTIKGKALTCVDLYVWTTDGQPATISLHSVLVDEEAQPLAKIKVSDQQVPFTSKLDIARTVATLTELDPKTKARVRGIEARVLAGRNIALFETEGQIALIPAANRHGASGSPK